MMKSLFDSIQKLIGSGSRSLIFKYLARYGYAFYRIYENHNYEFDTNGEKQVINKLKNIGLNTVFDVGANIGDWSLMICKHFNNAHIYAFEIVPATYNIAQKNSLNYHNIHLYNFGLSNYLNTLQINVSASDHHINSLHNIHKLEFNDTVQVHLDTGDNFCAKHNIDNIDFLKIDTEGHDYFVLEGFKKLIEQKKIRIIQFEYGRVNIQTKTLLYDHYLYLRKCGYVLGKIYPGHVFFKEYDFQDENFLGPNYLAVLEDDSEVIKILSNN
ncbi:MAG: FkbM family methyltransferase [Cytophagales bacterium]|nr:FkbM family methyltransferase [Cytophagales bacterium]